MLFGITAVCLLLRARAQTAKPRSFVSSVGRELSSTGSGDPGSHAAASTMQSDLLNARLRRGTLMLRRGVFLRRGQETRLRSTDDSPFVVRGLRRAWKRTVHLKVPRWLRRCVRSDTLSIKVVHLVVGAVVLLLAPSLGPALLLCAIGITRVRKRRMIEQHKSRRAAALPDLVDMIRLCVASGCTPYGAIVVLGSLPLRTDDVLAPLINEAARELERGAVVAEVLDWFQAEVGEAARPLCSALRSSAELGTPIAETLDLLAREARRTRKAQADVAAKRLPVLLLFPLITCILPAFALLAIVPLLGGALSALRW